VLFAEIDFNSGLRVSLVLIESISLLFEEVLKLLVRVENSFLDLEIVNVWYLDLICRYRNNVAGIRPPSSLTFA
jgi:hypothetical protein